MDRAIHDRHESQFLPKSKRAGSAVFARLSSMDLNPPVSFSRFPCPKAIPEPPAVSRGDAIHYAVTGRNCCSFDAY